MESYQDSERTKLYIDKGNERQILKTLWSDGYPIVQSGDSVRQNGLRIIEDDIRSVYLGMIRKPPCDTERLMLANTGEKCEND